MTTPPPRFSIVVVHYQGTIPHEIYLRGVNSLLNQTFKAHEILVYHDGPPLDPQVASPLPIRATPVRYNDWGHSLRDIGIREARGEYIVHFNADNILYPNALAELDRVSREPNRLFDERGNGVDNAAVLVFPIVMHDHVCFMDQVVRLAAGSGASSIFTGNPPAYGNIDCMQLVMRRELWLAEGGWRDKRKDGDGAMYPQFAQKYGYRGVGRVLGEHF